MRLWPSVLFLIGNPCFPSWLCCWLVTVSCPTLRDPMDCRPPGSPVHGISQGGILERVAISPPVALPDPGVESTSPVSPALAGRFFTTEPPGRPSLGSGRTQMKNPTIYSRGCHQLPSMMSYTYDGIWVRGSMAQGKTSKDHGVPPLLLLCPAGTQRTSGFISSDHCLHQRWVLSNREEVSREPLEGWDQSFCPWVVVLGQPITGPITGN